MRSHVFHGWTAEVLEGIIPPSHRLSPLASIFKKARILYGEAASVDLNSRCLKVKTIENEALELLPYGQLLIATGSRDHTERVPGMSQNGWTLKSEGDVIALRNHIGEVLRQAELTNDVASLVRLMTFVIVGGGFTGVEVCAAIAEMLRKERRSYSCLRRQSPCIILTHSGPALLHHAQVEKVSNYPQEQLINYGVDLRFGTRVTKVNRTGAFLSSGEILPAATIVSTMGQTLIPLVGTEKLPRSDDGRLITDSNLRVYGAANLWAGGDVACVRRPGENSPCPANALWAIQHGKLIGDNIARGIRGKNLRRFTFPGLGHAASFGIGKGFGELFGMQLTGWLPWIMRIFFFLYFMPSRTKAFRVALDWLLLPFDGWRGSRLSDSKEERSRRPSIVSHEQSIMCSSKAYSVGF
jgi:NADH dehydrogenase